MGIKRFCLFLALVFMLALPWHSASAESVTGGNLGQTVYWTFQDGTLTISGEGLMDDAIDFGAPWYHLREQITTVIVEEGIVQIGKKAFENCVELDRVQLPSTLAGIGPDAFLNCQSLTEITIPPTVCRIGEDAFRYCTALESITLPDGVVSMGPSVFKDCSSLQTVTLSEGLEEIPHYTFAGCRSLNEIVIPAGVTRIGDAVFKNCVSLTKVQFQKGAGYIGDDVFFGCSSLVSLTFPSGTKYFGDEVFRDCDSLLEIHFLGRMPSIGEDLFDRRADEGTPCVLYYPKDDETWTAEKMARWSRRYPSDIRFVPSGPVGCDHEVVIVQGTKPSCTEAGRTDMEYCSVCEEILKQQTVIDPLGHDPEVTVIAPTCTSPGYELHRCRRCRSEVRYHEVEAPGHSFGDWETVKIPTTVEEGVSERVCTACGKREQRTLERVPPLSTGPTAEPPTEPPTEPTPDPPTEPSSEEETLLTTDPAPTGHVPTETVSVQPEPPAPRERREAGIRILIVLFAVAGGIFLVKLSVGKRM